MNPDLKCCSSSLFSNDAKCTVIQNPLVGQDNLALGSLDDTEWLSEVSDPNSATLNKSEIKFSSAADVNVSCYVFIALTARYV